MSDLQHWQAQNAHYLSTALAWLRLRLEHLAQPIPTSSEAEDAPPLALHKNDPDITTISPLGARPRAATTQHKDQLAQYTRQLTEAEAQSDAVPALVMLSQRLGLTRFERDVLLLCIAMELDTRIASLCIRAQDDPNRAYPTFALALTLFDDPAWDVVSPEHPLRSWRLIEINQSGASPLTISPLRADERIVNYVKGLNYLDDRLSSLVTPFQHDTYQGNLPPSHQKIVDHIVHTWQQFALTSSATSRLPIIQLAGSDILSKQVIAERASARFGRQLYRISADHLPAQANDIEILARLWQRETFLLPLALYLDMQEVAQSLTDGQMSLIHRFLAHSDGIFFLGVYETVHRQSQTNVVFDVSKPTVEEQRTIWAQALGVQAQSTAPTEIANILAGQFHLNLPTIQRIAKTELSSTGATMVSLIDRLWDSCLRYTRPSLDSLAQRLELKVTWDDLVLPVEETQTLQQIARQVKQRNKVYQQWGFAQKMNRGMGINALFAGESGTGKTMAAEVIANDLHLNLYRIDLSAVVSKYIGETEKNLRSLFDAAEDGGAILFFDEADALFGKRSEVKDSHDRYANIEINYLLQRIEAYSGLAILATNMKNALDTAFMRRLRFIVTFSFPGIAQRKRMWQKVFPLEVPLDALDYDRLARLNLTGGSIHNIALNAAFIAAHEDIPVDMTLLMQTARSEFRKMERPINEVDFRWQPPTPAVQIAKE